MFADLPYARQGRSCTENPWDKSFPLTHLWEKTQDIFTIKWSAVFTATQPFASALVISNMRRFRYDWIWTKTHHSSPFTAKIQPLRAHEHCLVFGTTGATYNPQMRKGTSYSHTFSGNNVSMNLRGRRSSKKYLKKGTIQYGDQRYPLSFFSMPSVGRVGRLHPAQKPLPLCTYMVQTYTNPNDTVLDPVGGSATTAISALSCGRNVVVIEQDRDIFSAATDRVQRFVRETGIDADIDVRG